MHNGADHKEAGGATKLATPLTKLVDVLEESLSEPLEHVWEDAWLDKSTEVVADLILGDTTNMGDTANMVVIGPEVDADTAVGWAQELAGRNVHVITFVGELDPKAMLALTRAGVTDFLEPDADEDEWSEMLERGQRTAQKFKPARAGAGEMAKESRIIAVVTPRGGAGRTMIATNLAVGLSGHSPVVLVDLDVQFGGVASGLDLRPDHTMFDAAEMVRNGLDQVAMKVLLDRHPDGPYVLSAPETLSEAEAMTSQDSKSIILQLAEMFPAVIIDCAGGLNEHTLAALELATDVVLVGTPDTPSLETLRRTCDVMETVGFNPTRHLVLNRMTKHSKQAPTIFEQSLGLPVVCQIPESRQMAEHFQRGVPFFRHGGRDAPSRALQTLMDRFLAPSNRLVTRGRFRR